MFDVTDKFVIDVWQGTVVVKDAAGWDHYFIPSAWTCFTKNLNSKTIITMHDTSQ